MRNFQLMYPARNNKGVSLCKKRYDQKAGEVYGWIQYHLMYPVYTR